MQEEETEDRKEADEEQCSSYGILLDLLQSCRCCGRCKAGLPPPTPGTERGPRRRIRVGHTEGSPAGPLMMLLLPLLLLLLLLF